MEPDRVGRDDLVVGAQDLAGTGGAYVMFTPAAF